MKPVFIYARHTPKQMRIFASEQIAPPGQKVEVLNDLHPMFKRAVAIIKVMDDHMCSNYAGRRVQLELLAKHIVIPGVDLVHLRGHATAPDRILLKFETHH
jgi:hypothetical protein